MRKLKLLVIFIFVVNISNAQIVNFENISLDKKNIIQVSIGLNMAVIGNIEYNRVVKLKEKLFLISASVTLPLGKNILDDNKLSVNLSGNIIKKNNWGLPIHFGLFSTSISNKMNNISTIGTQILINPGYYKKKWFIASEVTYDKFILSYIKNSDYYKETYFSEAKDGWYKNSGGNFHLGIIGGKTINSSELNFKIGIIATEKLNTILVPYYALISYKFTF